MSELAIKQPVAGHMQPEAASQTSEKKPKMALWKKIVAGVVLFIVILVIIANMATEGAATASNAFMKNLLSSNSSIAYSMLSSGAQQTVTPEDFATVNQRMANVLGESPKMISKSVNGEAGSAATSTVVYEVAGSDGTYVITVNLTKENGVWKVLNFDSSLKK